MSKVRPERLLADDQEPKTTPTAKIPTLQSTPEAALVAALASWPKMHEVEIGRAQQATQSQSHC